MLERVLVLLRDGRTLFGVLRSIDQFGESQIDVDFEYTL